MITPVAPTFREAALYWLKLGFVSFGGPAGQIALMHTELVEKRRWISEGHFLHALNFCMFLPGPEAQQLATYLGWRLHGVKGGLAAGGFFVLPSVFILFGLSWLYMASGQIPALSALFYGLLPAVIAIVAVALLRVGNRSLRTPAHWAVAILSFCSLYLLGFSFVWVLLSAALIGWLGHLLAPRQFPANGGHGEGSAAEDEATGPWLVLPPIPSSSWRRTVRILVPGLLLWFAPVFALGLGMGMQSTPFQQGCFFSKTAMITFGGAYAVLPYVAQQAVEGFGWLSQGQMMAGLGLAESTPGPLIMVLQFVGFVGGWQNPGSLSPWVAASIGALITTWATFVPCFLLVFLGAPQVERFRDHRQLSAVMTTITAAVVGVILNLAVVFTTHALFPAAGGLDWFVLITAVLAFVALHFYKWSAMLIISLCAAAGLIKHLLHF